MRDDERTPSGRVAPSARARKAPARVPPYATNDYGEYGIPQCMVNIDESHSALSPTTMNAKLKICLAQTGRRQYQIAREAGLTENELSRIVRGRRNATADERRRIALVLGVDEPDLFGFA